MMIDLNRISRTHLETEPYRWASIDKLFSPGDAAALAATFPRDHFKHLAQHDGEKVFAYEIRCLIRMGEQPDHRDKIVTHVIYFNESWNDEDGGCLTILRSSDEQDVAMTVSPLVGNSAVLVRSDDSWHAVSHVAKRCRVSRRSLTATFCRPGCVSTVWPSWDRVLLHDYPSRLQSLWGRLKGRVGA